MPEETPALDESEAAPYIPLAGTDSGPQPIPTGPDGETAYRDPHTDRTFGTVAPAPSSPDRVQELLSRAVGDRVHEQRAVAEGLAEVRQLLPEIREQMTLTTEMLSSQLEALGTHVAEQEQATGLALGSRLEQMTAELGTQAQLSAQLAEVLAGVADDLGAMPRMQEVVRELHERPIAAPHIEALAARLDTQHQTTQGQFQELALLLQSRQDALAGQMAELEGALQRVVEHLVAAQSASAATPDVATLIAESEARLAVGMEKAVYALAEVLLERRRSKRGDTGS